MSESLALEDAGQDNSAPATALMSAGALLRQGRMAAGLHIAALAVALKVPVRRLEALESDRFDLLPDAVFVRALASSVCRVLKMDATPVLALLPASVAPRLNDISSQKPEAYTSGAASSGALWQALPKSVVTAAGVLALATVTLVFWPLIQESWTGPESSVSASGMLLTEVLRPVADTVLVPAVGASEPQTPSVVPSALAVSPAAPASVSASAALAPEPEPAAASPQGAPTATISGLVVFRPKAESWVEVTDAKGVVLLRRMLIAGEAAGVSGILPLSVVVGRADVTHVLVRGQAFDLSSIARENVARFEVK
jgi:cytoskeleton protein RodZ